ncbi:hypothetical protein AFLA_007373 [Aspergillus flavus NRRL3357]|nr:hypothetical protein AFLA_007373 [Aspergillus flavus NRRL3357]
MPLEIPQDHTYPQGVKIRNCWSQDLILATHEAITAGGCWKGPIILPRFLHPVNVLSRAFDNPLKSHLICMSGLNDCCDLRMFYKSHDLQPVSTTYGPEDPSLCFTSPP